MSKKLNILVIMSDQHNPKVTGYDGDPVVRTPNMDRLAAEGMRFDQFYCPSPVCVPSRMSFMTGRRPGENRVTDNLDILSSSIMTWPERLREAGYHTALIGRMHFEGPDQFHGFETTYEELRHWRGNRPVENQHESDQVPRWSYWSPRESIEQLSGKGTTFVQFRDEVVTRKGCEFIKEQASSADGRPFAAVIGLYQPHPPYVGKKELFDYYYERVSPRPETLDMMPEYLREYYELYHNWTRPEEINAESKRRALAAYYANCEHADQLLGQVLQAVDDAGLAENTLVIYTSDHGDMLGRFQAWGKNTMYDDSARIPMVARLPGVVPAGSVSKLNCGLRSLANTFCDIAGAEKLRRSDAPSLWSVMRGDGASVPDWAESEIVNGPQVFGQNNAAAIKLVRQGPFKLWCYYIAGAPYYSLFNLEEDPDELRDLYGQPELNEVSERLKQGLHEHWDPAREIVEYESRKQDRQELNAAWTKTWLKAGYAMPEDLDADVETPHTKGSQSSQSG